MDQFSLKITGRERLRGFMTVEEMRARIFAGKEEARARLATLPMSEKLRIMANMQQAAAPVRAARIKQQKQGTGTS